MKKAIRKKSRSPEHGRFRFFMVHIGLALVLTLLLVATAVSGTTLQNDVKSLSACSAGQMVKLQFPSVQNPIGPLGAWGAAAMIWLLGHLLTVLLLISFIVFQLAYLFARESTRLRWGIFACGWLWFFLDMTWISAFEPADNLHYFLSNGFGVIPGGLYLIGSAFLRQTGMFIAFGVLSLGFTVLVIRMRNIRRGLGWAYGGISGLSKSKDAGNAPRKNSKKKELEPRLISPDEDDIESTVPIDFSEIPAPKITDHYSSFDREDPVEAVPLSKKPMKRVKKSAESEEGEEEDREYVKPDINAFLATPPKSETRNREQIESEIQTTSQILREKLNEFGIEAQVVNVNIGPIITQYELKPAPGVKVSRFPSLADDLALAIKAKSIRVQAPIPGKGLIGIEVPNPKRDTIYLKDILLSEEMRKQESKLVFALGKDISGVPLVTDLTKMPHLLIAGATGAGKSVCINTAIISLLLMETPDDVRLILIDPKRIELSGYEGIPHLVRDVVTDPEEAMMVLNWAVSEMERRYVLLQKYGVRDITGYNEKVEKEPQDDDKHLPFVVIIVDEFADLIMTAGREIELPLARLAQMARAIGIHLILATQRPSIKVITGIIKANFPARIAFQVSSKMDSRVILDANGAERLLGRGDMLFLPPGKGSPDRIHGAFVSDREIENIVEYLRNQPKPKIQIEMGRQKIESSDDFEYDDELFPEAANAVVSAGTASVSMLQRHFKIGYARAGRLVDLLEQAGVIGPHSGSKSRDVLMTREELEEHGF